MAQLSSNTAASLAAFYADVFALPEDEFDEYSNAWSDPSERPNNSRFYRFLRDLGYEQWFYLHADTLITWDEIERWIAELWRGQFLKDNGYLLRAGPARVTLLAENLLAAYAENVVPNSSLNQDNMEKLKAACEADGFVILGNRLLDRDEDVVDAEEEMGLIEALYSGLGLEDVETLQHCLRQSEEHFRNEVWDDAIGDSRKALEQVFNGIVQDLRASEGQTTKISAGKQSLNYFEKKGLYDARTAKTFLTLYDTLSFKGNHPFLADVDEARLYRNLARMIAQYLLLSYRGYRAKQEQQS